MNNQHRTSTERAHPEAQDRLLALRELRARQGRELLLPSDAGEHEIALLRGERAVARLAAAFAALGYGLRIVPASYAPAPEDRQRPSAFFFDGDEQELCLGATKQATAEQLASCGARALALAKGFPVGRNEREHVICEALLQGFVCWFAAEELESDLPRRRVRHIARRLGERRLADQLDAASMFEAALHVWAALSVLPEDAQAITRDQIARIAPPCGAELEAVISAIGVEPLESAARAQDCFRRLRAKTHP